MNQPGASPGSITSSFVWDQVVVYAPAPGGGASAADIKAYAYAQLQYGRTSPLGFLKVTSFDEDPAHPIANVKTWLFFSPLGFLLHTKDYWAGATDARTVFEGGGGGGGGDVSDSSLGGTIVFTEVIPIETGPLSLPDIPHTFVDSGTSGADGNHARARLLTDDYSWIGPDMQLEQGGSGGSYEVWAMKGWIEFL